MRLRPVHLPALLLASAGVCAGPSQEAQPEYAIKARFLAQFPEFVSWPAGAGLDDPAQPFVVVVLGASPFERYLDSTLSSRKVKGHPAKIIYTQDLAALDGCQMAFICDSERGRIKEILARLAARPVLTVGDSEGFARKGVMINLTIEENLPRFEINLGAARTCGLGVNAQLLGLARKVW